MYRESHYHSTTHESLAVFRGNARMRFGVSNNDNADDGIELTVKVGDVIVIPAGIAHCALNESGGFCMVGSYPEVRTLLDCTDDRALLSGICVMAMNRMSMPIRRRSQRFPIPEMDPVEGNSGPLREHWKEE